MNKYEQLKTVNKHKQLKPILNKLKSAISERQRVFTFANGAIDITHESVRIGECREGRAFDTVISRLFYKGKQVNSIEAAEIVLGVNQ